MTSSSSHTHFSLGLNEGDSTCSELSLDTMLHSERANNNRLEELLVQPGTSERAGRTNEKSLLAKSWDDSEEFDFGDHASAFRSNSLNDRIKSPGYQKDEQKRRSRRALSIESQHSTSDLPKPEPAPGLNSEPSKKKSTSKKTKKKSSSSSTMRRVQSLEDLNGKVDVGVTEGQKEAQARRRKTMSTYTAESPSSRVRKGGGSPRRSKTMSSAPAPSSGTRKKDASSPRRRKTLPSDESLGSQERKKDAIPRRSSLNHQTQETTGMRRNVSSSSLSGGRVQLNFRVYDGKASETDRRAQLMKSNSKPVIYVDHDGWKKKSKSSTSKQKISSRRKGPVVSMSSRTGLTANPVESVESPTPNLSRDGSKPQRRKEKASRRSSAA